MGGVTPDEMVIVDGRQYRPDEVPGAEAGSESVDASGRKVTSGPVTPEEMVIVDGVLYRPEDAPNGKSAAAEDSDDTKAGAVTTKTAQPRNKARKASDKG